MSALRATAASQSASPALADRSKAWMCALQHRLFTNLLKIDTYTRGMNAFIHAIIHLFDHSLVHSLIHSCIHPSMHSTVCIAGGQVHAFLCIDSGKVYMILGY